MSFCSLVCKEWHRVVHQSETLCSIFYHRDIVELRDPLPFQWNEIVLKVEEDDLAEEEEVSWKQRVLGLIHLASMKQRRQAKWDWALQNGYLGLARRTRKHFPDNHDPMSPQLKSLHTRQKPNNLINALRCMVAMGYPLHRAEDISPWDGGGMASLPLLPPHVSSSPICS